MPADYERRILVFVTGLTPQVVTETLYAMVTVEKVIPTEIHLITTAAGRSSAERDLLDSEKGKFHAFCRDYGLTEPIRFDIHVFEDVAGNALTDIRTPEDNSRAADLIVRLMQEFCSDEKSAVYVSIAGGRKTMGFFAGYALSLFGREQDRLSHVLVEAPYENNREFFYPQPAKKGEPMEQPPARIAMADIPFVRMRGGLSEDLLAGDTGYSVAVAETQNRIRPPLAVSFDVASCTVTCGGEDINMEPSVFANYLWWAKRCVERMKALLPASRKEAEEYLQVHQRVGGKNSGGYVKAEKRLSDDESILKYFQEKRTRANKLIVETLGKRGAQPYLIQSNNKRTRDLRYEISLPAEVVTLPPELARLHLSDMARSRSSLPTNRKSEKTPIRFF